MKPNTHTIFTAAAITALSCTCCGKTEAAEGHADVLFGSSNGQLITLSEATGSVLQSSVFEAELPASFFTTDPGFNVEADEYPVGFGAPLPNTDITFTITAATLAGNTSNLFYWDADGNVNFNPLATGTTLSVLKPTGPGTSLSAVANGSANDVAGYAIDTTNNDGGIHKHLQFFMQDDDTAVAAGIYILPLTFSQAGLNDSDTTFLIFATDGISEEAHEAAAGFVTASIPEPASMMLLAFGAGLATLHRKRA
ncbi:PEP-CTERM sorting domain-containing protein [Poriferisphaera sp. WC338]|uniref:PEP-CTERM sorting domain-containing protein n=1 Tax=Poriferisphaera sp. WC338 TaxID=3425129 RepID=UPI003D81AB59